MKRFGNFALFTFIGGLGALLVFIIAVAIADVTRDRNVTINNMEVGDSIPLTDAPYSPEDFKENYAIDLKQDGYLIVDIHDGECYYVPFGQLEDWFVEMNI